MKLTPSWKTSKSNRITSIKSKPKSPQKASYTSKRVTLANTLINFWSMRKYPKKFKSLHWRSNRSKKSPLNPQIKNAMTLPQTKTK